MFSDVRYARKGSSGLAFKDPWMLASLESLLSICMTIDYDGARPLALGLALLDVFIVKRSSDARFSRIIPE